MEVSQETFNAVLITVGVMLFVCVAVALIVAASADVALELVRKRPSHNDNRAATVTAVANARLRKDLVVFRRLSARLRTLIQWRYMASALISRSNFHLCG